MVIAPNGKSVCYFEADESEDGKAEYILMYSNGKKEQKVTSHDVNLLGMANNGKYIYAVRTIENEDKNEYALYCYNAKGEGTELLAKADEAKAKFITAMDDDLNTADAIAAVFDFVRDINTLSATQSKETLEAAAKMFDDLTGVLGLLYNRKTDDIPQHVKDLVAERTEVRKAKNWARADAIRDELAGLGYAVEDTPAGPKIVKK